MTRKEIRMKHQVAIKNEREAATILAIRWSVIAFVLGAFTFAPFVF